MSAVCYLISSLAYLFVSLARVDTSMIWEFGLFRSRTDPFENSSMMFPRRYPQLDTTMTASSVAYIFHYMTLLVPLRSCEVESKL